MTQEPEWKDISTAPRDGSPICIRVDARGVSGQDRILELNNIRYVAGNWVNYENRILRWEPFRITHWRLAQPAKKLSEFDALRITLETGRELDVDLELIKHHHNGLHAAEIELDGFRSLSGDISDIASVVLIRRSVDQ